MATLSVWFERNDMLISLTGLRTSTMASTAYLNSSTNMLVNVWKSLSTASASDHIVTSRNMGYVSATNGTYRAVAQSTEHSMANGTRGLAIITLNHLGINGEWRAPFRVERRGTT